MSDRKNEDIDYEAEGNSAPESEAPQDRTDEGYDEAVEKGPSAFRKTEGNGGVFGTTGGGTFPEGMHVDEESER